MAKCNKLTPLPFKGLSQLFPEFLHTCAGSSEVNFLGLLMQEYLQTRRPSWCATQVGIRAWGSGDVPQLLWLRVTTWWMCMIIARFMKVVSWSKTACKNAHREIQNFKEVFPGLCTIPHTKKVLLGPVTQMSSPWQIGAVLHATSHHLGLQPSDSRLLVKIYLPLSTALRHYCQPMASKYWKYTSFC